MNLCYCSFKVSKNGNHCNQLLQNFHGCKWLTNSNKDIITKFKSQRFTHFGFIQCNLHSGKQLTVGSHHGLN